MKHRGEWVLDCNDLKEVYEYQWEVADDDLVVIDQWGNAVPLDELVVEDENEGE